MVAGSNTGPVQNRTLILPTSTFVPAQLRWSTPEAGKVQLRGTV